MLRKFGSRGAKRVPKLHLAAFGKHPGWDDHIPDLGLETDRLVEFRRVLYMKGIGGNIDAGTWDELDSKHLLPGFHHLFVNFEGDNWILGRMWSSQDGKGRSRYPMIVCVECDPLGFQVVGPAVFDQLQQIQQACTATSSGSEVATVVGRARDELRAHLLDASRNDDQGESAEEPNPLAVLAARDEMGEDQVGLVRLLYHIEREMSDYCRPKKQRGKGTTTFSKTGWGRSHHMRVPRCAERAVDALGLWGGFLRHQFGAGVPLWVVCPLDKGWADLLVGPASAAQFRCVRVGPTELPLTSDIPYQIDAKFIDRAQRLIAPALLDATAPNA